MFTTSAPSSPITVPRGLAALRDVLREADATTRLTIRAHSVACHDDRDSRASARQRVQPAEGARLNLTLFLSLSPSPRTAGVPRRPRAPGAEARRPVRDGLHGGSHGYPVAGTKFPAAVTLTMPGGTSPNWRRRLSVKHLPTEHRVRKFTGNDRGHRVSSATHDKAEAMRSRQGGKSGDLGATVDFIAPANGPGAGAEGIRSATLAVADRLYPPPRSRR